MGLGRSVIFCLYIALVWVLAVDHRAAVVLIEELLEVSTCSECGLWK